MKQSRSSTSQELHHLDQQDDLYLDITGEPARESMAGRLKHAVKKVKNGLHSWARSVKGKSPIRGHAELTGSNMGSNSLVRG